MNRIITGDCRDVMRDLIARGVKVQCVVTSPPYWGLRDYGIPPSVWGGDPVCAHEWGEEMKVHKGGGAPAGQMANRSVAQAQGAAQNYRAGQFCAKCPAWLGCLGLEPDYRMFVRHMVEVFDLARDLLADDGTLWMNLGDSYNAGTNTGRTTTQAGKHGYWENPAINMRINAVGLKTKDLCLMPARVAIALQDSGWWIRSDIIWHKPNPMPESITDRPTKSHEYLFLCAKSERYYYDADAIKETASPDTYARYARGRSDNHKYADGGPGDQTIAKSFEHMRSPGVHPKAAPPGSGVKANESFSAAIKDVVEDRNKRSVWTIPTQPYSEAHFATFPEALVEPCVLAGSRIGDIVFDPFMGSGTVAQVAQRLGRQYLGCDLNPKNETLQAGRLRQSAMVLA